MGRFNGVASKYISNYMQWFKWLRVFETDRDSIKTKNFIVQSNIIRNKNTFDMIWIPSSLISLLLQESICL